MIREAGSPGLNGRAPRTAPLRDLSNFVLRNRLLILGFVPVVLLATAAFLYFARPVYEAASSIRIDEEKSNLAVLDALKSLQSGSEISTDMEEMRSRTLAEAVVDSLALQVAVDRPRGVPRRDLLRDVSVTRTVAEQDLTIEPAAGRFTVRSSLPGTEVATVAAGEPVEIAGVRFTLLPEAARNESIRLHVTPFFERVRDFADVVDISRPNREANFAVIRYRGPDSVLVRQVPNAMARLFIARRNQVRRTESTSTISFLQEQLDTLNLQLRGAENRLRDFREDAQIIAPEAQAEASVKRLADLRAQRDLTEIERHGLRQLLDEISGSPAARSGDPSAYRRMLAFPSLLRNAAVGDLLNNLAEVENQRAELLMRYTMDNPDVQVLTQRIQDVERQLGGIGTTYLESLDRQVASFDTALGEFGDQLAQVPAKEVQYARYLRQATLLEEISTLLQKRLKEAQIAAAVEDPSVRVVDPAIPPDRPVWPKPVLSLALALVVGLSMGVGTAFAREHLDTTVRTREQLQLATAGAPVLGTIPRIRQIVAANGGARRNRVAARRTAMQSRLVAGRDPRNPASEAYRSLRTNITFARPEHAPRALVFTSPTPGDGKSTSAANLAITLVQQDLRCLLIDADMRRGVLHEVFGTEREPGLSNVLLGTHSVEQVARTVDVGPGGALSFMPMGTIPPNPAELLGSARMARLVESLSADYDMVILDAPPLTVVTDAALLGTNADGVILVARAGTTERGALAYAVEQLDAVHAPLLGVVLNDVDVRKDRYYGSYGATASYYYYASDERA